MTAHVSVRLADLLRTTDEQIIDQLLRSDAGSGFTQVSHNQLAAWRTELDVLRSAVRELSVHEARWHDVHLILEYRIPRREKRIDAILLLSRTIILLEFKVGAKRESLKNTEQLLDYALDIGYYHAASRGMRLAPILCTTESDELRFGPGHVDPPLEPIAFCGTRRLPEVLEALMASEVKEGVPIDPAMWPRSRYQPIPGIVEASIQLFREHDVQDIRSCLAGDERITRTVTYIDQLVGEVRRSGQKVLCMLTGVPGAGKTLAGLQVAHLEQTLQSDWRTVFITGNRPLLNVLRAALQRDYATRQKVPLAKAKTHAESLLQSVHAYIDEARSGTGPPIERIVVFDEAQRAWDAEKMEKMATRASRRGLITRGRGTPSAQSEPWEILEALDRHEGGAIVVALCGNGQEIHDGEAGIAEWLNARNQGFSEWQLVCSPVVAELAAVRSQASIRTTEELHLAIPIRAHRAQRHALWVEAVLSGRVTEAYELSREGVLPMYVTRDLEEARDWLTKTTLGTRRCGLLASSSAARLRPYGIEVTTDFRKGVDYAQWFIAEREDLRGSNALEVAATEFECQGLELDRVGLGWSWDLPIVEGRPQPRVFHGQAWKLVTKERARRYAENKYRVLLTRAREAMVIWVPRGRAGDSTRPPLETDAIATYLEACGVPPLPWPTDASER